jgi:hypothetical protein
MVVAMNADASRPVNLQVNVAATLPALPWIAADLLIGGIIFLTGGVLLIAVPLRLASGFRLGLAKCDLLIRKSAFDLGGLGLSRVLSVPSRRHFPGEE